MRHLIHDFCTMERYSFHTASILHPDLCLKFNLATPDELPSLESIDLHISYKNAVVDPTGILAGLIILREWTGQAPSIVFSKKSVSSFRLFEGTPLGGKLRLRGLPLRAFLDHLIHRDLPCIQKEFHVESPFPSAFDTSNEALLSSLIGAHMCFFSFQDPLFEKDEVRYLQSDTSLGSVSYGIESLSSFQSLAPYYSLIDALAGADMHFRQTKKKMYGLPLLLSGLRFPVLSGASS